MLTAYYDLSRNPPTFNFFDFLLQAEMKRLELGEERMRVRILPGPQDGFRRDSLPPYGGPERTRWLQNICIPMPRLLPSCGEAAELGEGDAGLFRGEYMVGFHVNVKAAKAGCYPFRGIPERTAEYELRYGKGYVTISMRESDWYKSRQSHLTDWLPAAQAIRAMGYEVVFIRDAAKADEQIMGFPTEPAASVNVVERASLYAGASMNLSISNGPAWFAWFMGVPVIIFNLIHTDEPYTSESTFRHCGLNPGEQLANARPGQRIVWGKDSTETILQNFTELVGEAVHG